MKKKRNKMKINLVIAYFIARNNYFQNSFIVIVKTITGNNNENLMY